MKIIFWLLVGAILVGSVIDLTTCFVLAKKKQYDTIKGCKIRIIDSSIMSLITLIMVIVCISLELLKFIIICFTITSVLWATYVLTAFIALKKAVRKEKVSTEVKDR